MKIHINQAQMLWISLPSVSWTQTLVLFRSATHNHWFRFEWNVGCIKFKLYTFNGIFRLNFSSDFCYQDCTTPFTYISNAFSGIGNMRNHANEKWMTWKKQCAWIVSGIPAVESHLIFDEWWIAIIILSLASHFISLY